MPTAHARALTALRICLGVFFIFEFVNKVGWLEDSGPLTRTLEGWLANAGPYNRWYLQGICLPGAVVFARLVPIGELVAGLALVLGAYLRPAAMVTILTVLNFHFASGVIFKQAFLYSPYGLPVLGGLLALTIGGINLPLSLMRK